MGGSSAIPGSTLTALASAGLQVQRESGANAIQTSTAFASFAISEGMRANYMGVATSNGYWDALTGGALCGRHNAVLVLASNANTTGKLIPSLYSSSMTKAYLFGGKAALGNDVFSAFESTSRLASRVSM